MAVASLMPGAHGIVMVIPPSIPNRRRRPDLVKLEKFSLPVARGGPFFRRIYVSERTGIAI